MRIKSIFALSLLLFFPLFSNPTAAAAPRPGQALVLTDAAGRTVRLETRPARIAVVGKGYHIILHALYMFPEARDLLVGSEKRGPTASDFLSAIDPDFDDKIFLNANPGPEQIAELRPDLVLAKHLTAGKLHEPLERIGIPVVYLDLETPDRFLQEIALLGRLLGSPDRAAKVADFFRGRLDLIQRVVAGLADSQKPAVLVVMYKRRGGTVAVQVPAVNWTQTMQVRRAGGIPVWVDSAQSVGAWTIVNLEQIASWDPERIFVVVPHSLDPGDVIETLRADSRWKSLRAVRSGGPEAFPADHFGWDSPDPRWLLGLTWLAHRLHPDSFADLDMRAEILAYFGTLYGMDEADVARVILAHLTPGTLGGR